MLWLHAHSTGSAVDMATSVSGHYMETMDVPLESHEGEWDSDSRDSTLGGF